MWIVARALSSLGRDYPNPDTRPHECPAGTATASGSLPVRQPASHGASAATGSGSLRLSGTVTETVTHSVAQAVAGSGSGSA